MPTIELEIDMGKGKKTLVQIDEEGHIKLETRGFKGKACTEETQFLKDLLGSETHRQLTPAYFMKDDSKIVKKYLPLCGMWLLSFILAV